MRSEINALWTRVRALQRKLARELAAYRLDLLSRDLCHRWFVAQSDHKPLPGIQPFIRRVIDAGYRLLPLGAANNYLQGCRRKDTVPDPETRCSTRHPPLVPVRSRPHPVGVRLAEGKTWKPVKRRPVSVGARAKSFPHRRESMCVLTTRRLL